MEDVSVVDNKGQPVTGLPRSAFRVFDNNVEQSDFMLQEQASAAAESDPAPDRVFSNASLLKGGTTVALLLDPMSLEVQDQMYLRIQALEFIDHLQPGIRVGVFRTNNQGVAVELQSPTTDRALVQQAVGSSIPVMARPIDNQFQNAIAELKNLSEVLRPFPGNKALFWMAGQFPLFVQPDYAGANDQPYQQREQTRSAYLALQEARIAVYPIDARGVLQPGGTVPPAVMSQSDTDRWAQDPSRTPRSFSSQVSGEWDVMDQLASATGGMALYSNNGVSHLMETALRAAEHTYSLSLRPGDTGHDAKWHSVRITVDGPYTVRYRRGYFPGGGPAQDSATHRRLLPSGEAPPDQALQAEIRNADLPLQFSARVLPDREQGKNSTVKIRYTIPVNQLSFASGSAAGQSRFRLTALAYNAWGDILGHAVDVVQTRYSSQQIELAARIGVPADQTVGVQRGARYLMLAVEDLQTRRVGTVQLSLASVQAGNGPAPSAGAQP